MVSSRYEVPFIVCILTDYSAIIPVPWAYFPASLSLVSSKKIVIKERNFKKATFSFIFHIENVFRKLFYSITLTHKNLKIRRGHGCQVPTPTPLAYLSSVLVGLNMYHLLLLTCKEFENGF